MAKNEINQFIIFRDASFGTCSYNLSLMDVLNGLYKVHKHNNNLNKKIFTWIPTKCKNCGEVVHVICLIQYRFSINYHSYLVSLLNK